MLDLLSHSPIYSFSTFRCVVFCANVGVMQLWLVFYFAYHAMWKFEIIAQTNRAKTTFCLESRDQTLLRCKGKWALIRHNRLGQNGNVGSTWWKTNQGYERSRKKAWAKPSKDLGYLYFLLQIFCFRRISIIRTHWESFSVPQITKTICIDGQVDGLFAMQKQLLFTSGYIDSNWQEKKKQ